MKPERARVRLPDCRKNKLFETDFHWTENWNLKYETIVLFYYIKRVKNKIITAILYGNIYNKNGKFYTFN